MCFTLAMVFKEEEAKEADTKLNNKFENTIKE
jgi:hypothetical protein